MPAAALLAALAMAAQPADDAPVATALEARSAADALGLDDQQVPIPPSAKPATEEKTAPAAMAAARTLTLEPKTMVDGGTLQVVMGQRALFRLDSKGLPVLDKVEEGQLADAHPDGTVTETFEPPPEGQIAVALDGSAETRSTVLKVWNGTESAIDYRAIALVLRKGKLTPAAAPICPVAAGAVRTETWPRPVVAVGLQRFKPTLITKACP